MTHCSQQGETSKAGTLETPSSDPPRETSLLAFPFSSMAVWLLLTAAQWFNRLVKMHLFRFLFNENRYTNYIINITIWEKSLAEKMYMKINVLAFGVFPFCILQNLMTMLSSMNFEWSKELCFNGSKKILSFAFCFLTLHQLHWRFLQNLDKFKTLFKCS